MKVPKFFKFIYDHSGTISGVAIATATILHGVVSDLSYDAMVKANARADKAIDQWSKWERRSNMFEDALVLTRTALNDNPDAKVDVKNLKGETNELRDVLKDFSKEMGIKIQSVGDDWDVPEGKETKTIDRHAMGDMSAYEGSHS